MLPGRGCRTPEYDIAGHLESAYRARADVFDWSQDDVHLTLTLVDGSNSGGVHALQSTLTLTALLLLIELGTGLATVVLAGSPRLLILREGQFYEPRLTGQVPMGMFQDNDYVEQVALACGDRVAIVSDGVHEARGTHRDRFGEVALADLLSETATESVERVMRRVVDELYTHRGDDGLDDNAVVVCRDWTGPGRPAATTGSAPVEASVELQAWAPKLRAVMSR